MLFEVMRPAAMFLLLMTALTGVAYPLAVTAVGQMLFPAQASGSMLFDGERIVGSSLIGQPFSQAGHFWGRPSATGPYPYNAAASGGSNLGPIEPSLAAAVAARIEALRAADPGDTRPVPVDLVTSSASGLDPHVSPAAAQYQVARVARARGLPVDTVRALVARHTEHRTWGLLGEERVNVLRLNLELERTGRPVADQ